MARKRMIDPDFWTDESLGQCTPMERLLFMGLISQADDAGRLRGNPALIRSQIFPYDDVTASDTEMMLERLSDSGLIERYTVEGQAFIWLPGFGKHQTINKPTPSKLPGPESADISQESPTTVGLPEQCNGNPVGLPPKRREEKRREIATEVASVNGAEPSGSGRRRDLHFETFVRLFEYDPSSLNDTERGKLNKAVKLVKQSRGSPEDIETAFRVYPDAMPAGTKRTALAVASNFQDLLNAARNGTDRVIRTEDVYPRLA